MKKVKNHSTELWQGLENFLEATKLNKEQLLFIKTLCEDLFVETAKYIMDKSTLRSPIKKGFILHTLGLLNDKQKSYEQTIAPFNHLSGIIATGAPFCRIFGRVAEILKGNNMKFFNQLKSSGEWTEQIVSEAKFLCEHAVSACFDKVKLIVTDTMEDNKVSDVIGRYTLMKYKSLILLPEILQQMHQINKAFHASISIDSAMKQNVHDKLFYNLLELIFGYRFSVFSPPEDLSLTLNHLTNITDEKVTEKLNELVKPNYIETMRAYRQKNIELYTEYRELISFLIEYNYKKELYTILCDFMGKISLDHFKFQNSINPMHMQATLAAFNIKADANSDCIQIQLGFAASMDRMQQQELNAKLYPSYNELSNRFRGANFEEVRSILNIPKTVKSNYPATKLDTKPSVAKLAAEMKNLVVVPKPQQASSSEMIAETQKEQLNTPKIL
jgi:hypothetical protein